MAITWSLDDVAQHNSQRSVRLPHLSPKSDLVAPVIAGSSLTAKCMMSPTSFPCVRSASEWPEFSPESLQEHPGGKQIILKYAGRDATAAYKPIHPDDALEKNLPKVKCLGPVSVTAEKHLRSEESLRKKTKDEIRVAEAQARKPPLKRILTLQDMEVRLS